MCFPVAERLRPHWGKGPELASINSLVRATCICQSVVCLAGAGAVEEASHCPGALAGPASRELLRPLSSPGGGAGAWRREGHAQPGGPKGAVAEEWGPGPGPVVSLHSEGSSSRGPRPPPRQPQSPSLQPLFQVPCRDFFLDYWARLGHLP